MLYNGFPDYPYLKYPTLSGTLTNEYAEWLENGGTSNRLKFQFDTGLQTTYLKNDKRNNVVYSKMYKEWLEELRCNDKYFKTL